MKRLLAVTLLFAIASGASAEVVRPAPGFAWETAGGRMQTLKSLHGQPVVLIIARSPRTRAFRKQVKVLKELYQQFAARNVIFVAAFREGSDFVPSDIPFVVASNGAEVAAAYGVDTFSLAVIGTDGNLDLQTGDVKSAERIRDVLNNSYEAQKASRK